MSERTKLAVGALGAALLLGILGDGLFRVWPWGVNVGVWTAVALLGQVTERIERKLQELEQLYTKTRQGPAANEHVRELTLCSLRKRINQFKEEITRFKARVRSAAADD